jgi:hypothetical protein
MRATLLLLCLIPACLPTESAPVSCTTDKECTDIGAGLRCDLTRKVCVCAGGYFPGCDKGADGGPSADGPSDLPVSQPDAVVQPDVIAPLDVIVQPDVPVDVAVVDTPADLSLPDTVIDSRVPDASGTCGTSSDCPDPSKSFCVGGVCTGCSTILCASRVDGGTAVCATSGTAAGKCVECVADAQCAGNPAKGFCVNNACTGCTIALCAGKVDGGASLICATSGTAAGQCVECMADAQCTKDPAKGFCTNNACTGCTTALCAGKVDGGASLICATSGTAAGQCVECVDSTGCTKDPAKGFCTNNACTGCTAALCAGRTDGKTACATTGTFTGQCVACTSNAQCSGTTPVCNAATDTCRACVSDSECSAGPGVCLTDGHCAMDAEAIYVGTLGSTTCSESNAGTALAPVCSLQNGVSIAKSGSKPVVIVRGVLASATPTIAVSSPLTIVGRNSAVVTPSAGGDAITITSGEIHLRNLTIQGTATPKTGIGINAISGVTLHMDTCAVKDNPGGGILLNGAAFDIKNTTVTGNGPGQTGVSTWGGILVQSLPATGSTSLNLVSIQSNKQVGLSCAGGITGTGVLASENTGGIDINTTCAITACTPASATCGAQSQPQ